MITCYKIFTIIPRLIIIFICFRQHNVVAGEFAKCENKQDCVGQVFISSSARKPSTSTIYLD